MASVPSLSLVVEGCLGDSSGPQLELSCSASVQSCGGAELASPSLALSLVGTPPLASSWLLSWLPHSGLAADSDAGFSSRAPRQPCPGHHPESSLQAVQKELLCPAPLPFVLSEHAAHQARLLLSTIYGKEPACQCRRSLGREDPLEEAMAARSSILAGESPGQRSLLGCSP